MSKKRVEVSPGELVFDLGAGSLPLSATLRITNPHSDQSLAFKVKTTSPKRFLVRPNQEVLPPGGSVEVLIQVQDHSSAFAQLEGVKDKFLIATCLVDEATVGKLKLGGSSAAGAFQHLWDVNKEDQANRRVACLFTYASSPSLGAAKQAPVFVPAAATVPAQPPANTNPSTTTNPSTSVGGGGGGGGESYDNLARAHKETIALLVQITQERDLALKKLRELQSASNLQAPSTTTTTSAAAAAPSSTVQGFVLWHLLLVAMVAVLVTRWLSLTL